METAERYIAILAEIFRTIDGEGGQSAAWNMAGEAIGLIRTDDYGVNDVCRLSSSLLYGKGLSYAVYLAENGVVGVPEANTGLIPAGDSVWFDPAGNWMDFTAFLGRHPELREVYLPGPTVGISGTILRSFVDSAFGPYVDIPLRLL